MDWPVGSPSLRSEFATGSSGLIYRRSGIVTGTSVTNSKSCTSLSASFIWGLSNSVLPPCPTEYVTVEGRVPIPNRSAPKSLSDVRRSHRRSPAR